MIKKEFHVENFSHYVSMVESISNDAINIMLFRGQNIDKPLLPAIARVNPRKNTFKKEIRMINELKRKSYGIIENNYLNNTWDWLIYAQHFGMRTRLLDWTSNPLVALFFACYDLKDSDSYVYLFFSSYSREIKSNTKQSPFKLNSTKIIKPPLNNERIIAQSGWFSVHPFSISDNSFISFDDENRGANIWKYIIPKDLKIDIMDKLNIFNINFQTMFPDIDGLCKQINWEFR